MLREVGFSLPQGSVVPTPGKGEGSQDHWAMDSIKYQRRKISDVLCSQRGKRRTSRSPLGDGPLGASRRERIKISAGGPRWRVDEKAR